MNNAVTYKVGREGMDLNQRPGTDEDIQDFLRASHGSVMSDSPITHRHEGSPNPEGPMKSDLMDAPAREALAPA